MVSAFEPVLLIASTYGEGFRPFDLLHFLSVCCYTSFRREVVNRIVVSYGDTSWLRNTNCPMLFVIISQPTTCMGTNAWWLTLRHGRGSWWEVGIDSFSEAFW